MVETILIGFLVAVLVGLVVYAVSSFVPFLKPYREVAGLAAFALVALLYILSSVD